VTSRSAWFSIRSSFWFIPSVALFGAIICAVVLVWVDARYDEHIKAVWPKLLLPDPDGARQILSTIASSMITVAGVIFSVTIVALSLAANQYSPRILRNFMRDRINQVVLAVFTASFVYCLLVLQAIRSDSQPFVPFLAVWAGILFAILSIGFLILFIHRTAMSIQVSEIMSRISRESVEALAALQRMADVGGAVVADAEKLQNQNWHPIASTQSGYIQDIDTKKLFRLACERQVIFRVDNPVGEFVVEGRPLVSTSEPMDSDFSKRVRRLFGISSYRTVEQDPAFGIRQIVDIALRALSPGINDATTAINSIDYLHIVLQHVVSMKVHGGVHMDGETPRLQLQSLGPEHLLDIALNEIRQNAREHVSVLLRLLRLVRQLLQDASAISVRKRLLHHANLILEESKRSVPEPADRAEVESAYQKILEIES
jgi:uncharacterized membrane protein